MASERQAKSSRRKAGKKNKERTDTDKGDPDAWFETRLEKQED